MESVLELLLLQSSGFKKFAQNLKSECETQEYVYHYLPEGLVEFAEKDNQRQLIESLNISFSNHPIQTKGTLELYYLRLVDSLKITKSTSTMNPDWWFFSTNDNPCEAEQKYRFFLTFLTESIDKLSEQFHFLMDLYDPSIDESESQDDKLHNPPFKDQKTQDLFKHIVKNWDNDRANKWGYIWEFLWTKGNGRLTGLTEYENYIRSECGFTKGKPNYGSCNSTKHFEKLTELYDSFIKK